MPPCSSFDPPSQAQQDRLCAVTLVCPHTGISPTMDEERRVAIFDLLEHNVFRMMTGPSSEGPYHLTLFLENNRLIFDVKTPSLTPLFVLGLSLSSLRKMIKDYFILCERYYATLSETPLHQLETLDMARRSLHNEASELLIERLKGKIEIDFHTARRLFTLIAVLHWRAIDG